MPRSKIEPLVTEADVCNEIHSLIDDQLLVDLGEWLNARPKMKTLNVASTLAYLVADCLAMIAERHGQVCIITRSYADYIHQTAHHCFDTNADEDREKREPFFVDNPTKPH